ncbi:tRNA (adenine(22)-N(1))-methyltransferase [Listeria booriae]|uniref:tRNA (adenine(22)-N(1))-methyltransferase n=1 Tax=Listeria booriae TaxID=1552123 RepID=UPI00162359D1|nr:tRNA (adenine(22)-N(1))-methyltransferase TrmK [Listeria booriae]MBC1511755.1 tRNA (adenine-N(1))-methyltransferase [Listeria booriae]MBC6304801.1 tRNA (adenine-N(1))-methyltransferase [Listeria booriae]
MNEQQLSKRLEKVVLYVSNKARIADIGSDHAYLPCYAIQQGLAEFAIAGEVVEGPFQSATKQVRSLALTEQIAVRKGDGLAVIEPADAIDTIVIAGMGGALIRSILEAEPAKLDGVKRLVLQPNIAAHQLREWAEINQWKLVAESILREDHKIYEILVLEPSEAKVAYSDAERLLGPFLMREKSEVFQAKWEYELANWIEIRGKIDANSAKNAEKLAELDLKIKLIGEVLR